MTTGLGRSKDGWENTILCPQPIHRRLGQKDFVFKNSLGYRDLVSKTNKQTNKTEYCFIVPCCTVHGRVCLLLELLDDSFEHDTVQEEPLPGLFSLAFPRLCLPATA